MRLPFRKFRAALASALLVASLAACGPMGAQNPSGRLKPVNAVAEGEDSRVMLKGADVVAYFTQDRFVQGNPRFKSVYQDVSFRFASAEHKALFDKEPEKYQPRFGGYCANGIVYGIPWGGDADTWKMTGGKLYIFGGQASKDAFELDEKRNLDLAEKYWKEEVAGNNSFLQRGKRLVLKVPHYQTGEQLAQAVAAAKAARGAPSLPR
jgi:YHS domain-containing protein